MVPHWPGNDVKVGQVGGIAVDNNKEVVIFQRGSRSWGFKYDSFKMISQCVSFSCTMIILDLGLWNYLYMRTSY